MPRRRRSSPSVFNLSRQAYNPRAASPSASATPSFTETAPQTSVLGPPMEKTLTPDVQSYAPEGAGIGSPGLALGGAAGPGAMQPGGSGLMQAILGGEPAPTPTAGGPPVYQPGFEGQGDYEIPYSEGPTNGDPGGPRNPTPEPMAATAGSTYNKNKLMRMLLEGY